MATPPERYKTAESTFSLALSMNNRGCHFSTFFEAEISKKTRVKSKPGSKKYRHLQRFIKTRRQKKREKRCTLDRSAQVILSIEIIR